MATATPAAETKVANVAEFDAAVKAARPGDAIVLRNGEWRDVDLVFRGEGIVPLLPSDAGKERWLREGSILLRAETPGGVILTGTSRLRIGGRRLLVEGLHWKNTAARDDVIAFRIDSKTAAEQCTVRECAIVDDAVETGLADEGSKKNGAERKWVSIYGRRNAVENCRFEGKRSAGALLVVWLDETAAPDTGEPLPNHWPIKDSLEHRIEKNFFGPREKLGKNGGETIRIGDSKTSLKLCGARVADNYFYRCDGEAEIISNKSCGNVYWGNVFVGCSGALTLRHGNGCDVSSNSFFGDGRKGTGGVRVVGANHAVAANMFRELTGDEVRAALCVMNGIPESPADGYVRVRRLEVTNNRFLYCKQHILIGFADKDRKNQTLAPDDLRFEGNVVRSKEAPAFELVAAPTTWTSTDNTYFGKLGMPPNIGWTESTDKNVYYGDGDVAVTLSESGPNWFRPADEFLPRITIP